MKKNENSDIWGGKMKKSGIPAIASAIIALVVLVLFGSCSNEHNVNSGNLVTMSGFVFQSRTNKVPVPGVTVIVEKSEESSSESIIPDQFTITDESGRWEVKYSLGYLSTGDEDVIPVDPEPVWIEESMRIIMFTSDGLVYDLGSGFSVQVGENYDLWDVFLTDFTVYSDSTGN